MSSSGVGAAIVAKGISAKVEFDGKTLTITRGWLTGPDRRGERAIPVSQISGVDLRPATLSKTGAFTIVLPGAVERRKWSGKRNESRNENSIEFPRRQNAQFKAIRDAVVAAL